jgi:molybdopterin synthase sulfur carrier subunit
VAELHLPRSLIALFPAAPRHLEIDADSVEALVRALDVRWPGMWDRLCEPGPRLREHINVFVDGERVAIAAQLTPAAIVHIIPAVAGGSPPAHLMTTSTKA